MKKIISLLLITVMSLVLLSACTSSRRTIGAFTVIDNDGSALAYVQDLLVYKKVGDYPKIVYTSPANNTNDTYTIYDAVSGMNLGEITFPKTDEKYLELVSEELIPLAAVYPDFAEKDMISLHECAQLYNSLIIDDN